MNRIRHHIKYPTPDKSQDPFEAAVLANTPMPEIAQRFGLSIYAAAAKAWRIKKTPFITKVEASIRAGMTTATICKVFHLTPKQVEGRKYRMNKADRKKAERKQSDLKDVCS